MARPKLLMLLAAAIALGTVLAVAGWLWLAHLDRARLAQPLADVAEPRLVDVPPGSSLKAVASRLAADGLLAYPGSWVREARREGLASRLRAGEFLVKPGMTGRELLDEMVAGRVYLHSLTIPEGWTFRQAFEAIEHHPAVQVTLAEADDAALRKALGLGDTALEGMLFPDTYLFARGTTDEMLLRQAHEREQQELDAAWAGRAPDLPLASAYQALILASIVEKETGAPDERPLIAGVFVNRLRRGMRLQTDPTVIYGMGSSFDGNLRRADMERDTPYNTYTRAGLPPTPIALAGRDALTAAVHPAATDDLFFVATGRGDGRHRFARTLAEHNDNVARYIATLRGAAHEAR